MKKRGKLVSIGYQSVFKSAGLVAERIDIQSAGLVAERIDIQSAG